MRLRNTMTLALLFAFPILSAYVPPPPLGEPCELPYRPDCCETPPYYPECCECPGVYGWPICLIGGHRFSFGPQAFYVQRRREGGSIQTGWLYGGQIMYEYIKPRKLYWGAEVNAAVGRISGHSGTKNSIKSIYGDSNIEARMGYTLALQRSCYQFLFIPFLGGGAAVETNHFIHPSPIHLRFRLYYGFISTGFISQFNCSPWFDVGLNFKTKFMLDAKNKVSHDPSFDSSTCLVGNEVLYRVELPVTWKPRPNGYISLVPFYEYRHYGGHKGFPFDFLDTKLNFYGAVLKFIYLL